ncbi:MAG: AAA family ATPase [Gammaproteobacteria bacterium]|nr:AAA family ATPase [Gammaproteobacteria bacterium]
MHNAGVQVLPIDASLVEALLREDAFPHPAGDIELMETHISWVILAGNYAYKIKKPVVLDFLDFGTLEKRRHFCEEELRLNRPWAPELYLDVVAIAGPASEPVMGGDGEALEYAVKMLRFDQDLRLDRQLDDGLLTVSDMKELGQKIAARHADAERPDPAERERLTRQAIHYFWENFDHLGDIIEEDELAFLRDWTARELEKHATTLRQRFDDGFVCDCHGDLHLGNLVRLPSGITTFDCIEFNSDLRYTDVFADVGFLTMDLTEKGHPELAAHFLNRYLERSGDYEGAVLLDLFFVYRCLVRAKVAAIRSRERESEAERCGDIRDAREYSAMARRQATRNQPVLIIMCGLSGSGKTWLAERLMAALPAIRVRSDIERKRLFGLEETAGSGSGIGEGIYSAAASEATYKRLFKLARSLLKARHHVVLDAAFLKKDLRQAARELAADTGRRSVLVHADAPANVLKQRIDRRVALKDEASEADIAVLDHQLETSDELTEDEARINVDTSRDIDIDALAATILECRNR